MLWLVAAVFMACGDEEADLSEADVPATALNAAEVACLEFHDIFCETCNGDGICDEAEKISGKCTIVGNVAKKYTDRGNDLTVGFDCMTDSMKKDCDLTVARTKCQTGG